MLKAFLSISLLPGLLASVCAAQPRLVVDDSFEAPTDGAAARVSEVSSGDRTYFSLKGTKLFSRDSGGLRVHGAWALAALGFEPVMLARPGDALILTLGIRYETPPADLGGALRIGLYDTGANRAALHPFNRFNNPEGGGARGYFAAINTGGEGGTNFYRDPGKRTHEKQAVFDTATDNRVVGFKGAAFADQVREVILTITRTADGLAVSGTVAGVPFAIRENRIGEPVTTAFDTLVFGSGNSPAGYVLTRVSIATTAVR